MKNDTNPIVNFIYFFIVIVFSMIFLHPIFLLISFLVSLIYSAILNGVKAIKFNFGIILPMMLFMIIINPLLNHRGVTILVYLGENPITLEAIVYGAIMSLMFASVIFWFSCYNKIMTSEKITYLFGRSFPSVSLIISMIFRFIPMYKNRMKLVVEAQRGIGNGIEGKSIIFKIKDVGRVISIMTTWALDSAINTANSMKSRGYGLSGRKSFTRYKFKVMDIVKLIIIAICVCLISIGGVLGVLKSVYFPSMIFTTVDLRIMIIMGSWLLLCIIGMIDF